MKKQKFWNLTGAILGVLVIIVGIYFIRTPASSRYTSTADSASFGGDFYTYEYEATQKAANNVAAVADNIGNVGAKLALYNGSLFIVIGLVMVLHFGKLYSCDSREAQITSNASSIPDNTEPNGTDITANTDHPVIADIKVESDTSDFENAN